MESDLTLFFILHQLPFKDMSKYYHFTNFCDLEKLLS